MRKALNMKTGALKYFGMILIPQSLLILSGLVLLTFMSQVFAQEVQDSEGVLIPITPGANEQVESLQPTQSTTIALQNLELTTATVITPQLTPLTDSTLPPPPEHPDLVKQANTNSSPTSPIRSNDPSVTPIFLRARKPLEIFDAYRDETGSSQLRDAAEVVAKSKQGRQPQVPLSMAKIVTEDYTLSGINMDAIKDEAQSRTLKAAAARLYFGQCVLMGMDLLGPFMDQRKDIFLTQTTVLAHKMRPNGDFEATIRVGVNLDKLVTELRNKFFIAEPNLYPKVASHLFLLVNGEAVDSSAARAGIAQTLDDNLYLDGTNEMETPSLNLDLTDSEAWLREARMEAQRNGVDLLITGTITVNGPAENATYLYDNYIFQNATSIIRLYRVDTGELIAEHKDIYEAADLTTQSSIDTVSTQIAVRATRKFIDMMNTIWPKTMLDQTTYRVMLTGITPEKLPAVRNFIKSLAPHQATLYQKIYYGDVLIINIDAPSLDPKTLEHAMKRMTDVQFSVRNPAENVYVLKLI